MTLYHKDLLFVGTRNLPRKPIWIAVVAMAALVVPASFFGVAYELTETLIAFSISGSG